MRTKNIIKSILACSIIFTYSCKKKSDDEPTVTSKFTANQTNIYVGDAVEFTDKSTGDIQSWLWEFEGGSPESSSDQNPTVTYNAVGKYNVSLQVNDALSSQKVGKPNYINVQDLIFKNLIGHFKLDGNTHDLSTLYSSSLVYGSPSYTTDRDGNSESAILIEDPNQFFTVDELQNNNEIEVNDAVTICAWVNLNKQDTVWNGIVTQWDSTITSGLYLGVNPTNSTVKWNIGGESIETSNGLVLNEWTHIAVTYDGAKLKLYINNVLKQEKTYAGGTSSSSMAPFTIGAESNFPKGNFKGAIDDVYVYSRALSSSEITELYNE